MGCKMTDMKKIHRELAALKKNIQSQFDGQLKLEDTDLDDNLVIRFTLCPNAGIYRDCEMVFTLDLENYPENRPHIVPISRVLHPNIDYHPSYPICLNILDEWRSYSDDYKSLDLLVQGLIFLFHQPEVDDPSFPLDVYNDLDNLEHNVDRFKHVEEVPTELKDCYPFDTFSQIYRKENNEFAKHLDKMAISTEQTFIPHEPDEEVRHGTDNLDGVRVTTVVMDMDTTYVKSSEDSDDTALFGT